MATKPETERATDAAETGLFAVKESPRLDAGQRAFRRRILPVLDTALRTGALTLDSDAPVTRVDLMADGYGSVVYRLRNDSGASRILKITDSETIPPAEAAFLDRWRAVGVRTPRVYRVGALTDASGFRVPFLLMEFLSGQSLFDRMEAGRVPEAETQRALGGILARMHSVRTHGYGAAGSGHLDLSGGTPVGTLARLQEQLAVDGALDAAIRLAVETRQIAPGGDVTRVHAALAALEQPSRIDSVLAHTDFRAGNILYDPTRSLPCAVIDPYPTVTHPYLCLAYTLILDEIHAGRPAFDIAAGYAEVAPVDEALLREAMLLQSVRMSNFGRDPASRYARNLRDLFARLRTDSATALPPTHRQ